MEHFIENKQVEELIGLTLFIELKEQIIDGESHYGNLKLFLKLFEKKINRAKPWKKGMKENGTEK